MTLAVGETKFIREKKPILDEDGKVLIGPKNISIAPVKKGKVDSTLFSAPTHAAVGEPFQEAARQIMRTLKKDGHLEAGHETAFRPAKEPNKDLKTHSAYPHKPEIEHKKKNFLDADGVVMIAPRNFLTNPPKKGQVGKQT